MEQVGCSKCGKGLWKINTDGKVMEAECANCNYKTKIPPDFMSTKPDNVPIPLRFLT